MPTNLRHPDGSTRVLKTKEVGVELAPGDVIEVHSGGGGGWGEPRATPHEAAGNRR